MIGIQNFASVAADIPFVSTTVLRTVGLSSPIAAGQSQKIRAWIRVALTAVGLKLQVSVPAGVADFGGTLCINDPLAPSATPFLLPANTPISQGPLPGVVWVEVECFVQNGPNAGVVDIQFAQDVSDPGATTVLKGGSMEIIKF